MAWRHAPVVRVVLAIVRLRTIRVHPGDPVARVARLPRSASRRFAPVLWVVRVVWVIVAVELHRAVRILAGDTVPRHAW